VNVRANEDMTKQVARLLRRRPGWSLQENSTPGAPPVWCFGSRVKTDLSVKSDTGSICVHVVETDQEVTLGGASELVAWLATHRPAALHDPKSGVLATLRSGKLFRWE
jgi:hypothetical protein